MVQQLGIKEQLPEPSGLYDTSDEPIQCAYCDRMFASLRALYMHARRKHFKDAPAASVVTSSNCSFLQQGFS